jgi:hypothetical protein
MSAFAYYSVVNAFRKYRNFPQLQCPEEWNAFRRKDFNKWEEAKIIKGCFTLFPLHFLKLGSYLIFKVMIVYFNKWIGLPYLNIKP